ncbi:MAG: hypothetical protein NZ866_02465 [Patescibacteria group bacterium]|nr:hypothetical protein [Patescibacteria group bacterium]
MLNNLVKGFKEKIIKIHNNIKTHIKKYILIPIIILILIIISLSILPNSEYYPFLSGGYLISNRLTDDRISQSASIKIYIPQKSLKIILFKN